jgi:hypothetical protein
MKYDSSGREVYTFPLNENTTVTGDWIFAGNRRAIEIEGTTPSIYWDETDAAADERLWEMIASGGALSLQTRTDADGVGAAAMTIDRTGTVVDSITFPSEVICTKEGATLGSGLMISNAVPILTFNETDAAANNRRWRIAVATEQMLVSVRSDADNSGLNFIVVDRTANVVDSIAITATATSFSGQVGFNGATPAARPDYTVTNPTTDRALNVTADTLAQGLAVLGTVIADLIAIGLFQ